MGHDVQKSNLSLRGLEIFQLIARTGSARKVSKETGLSISTISHHLRSVEENLGVDLVDHSRRPMVLTPAGVMFARYVEEGLGIIKRGETALLSGNLAQVRDLRLGIVDDFDTEVAPELAQQLARAMPSCTFKQMTRPSLDIIRMVHEKKLDVGVATQPTEDTPGLIAIPLLRDPFVVAMPASLAETPADLIAGRSPLPFLRYSENLLIGNLIEAQLRRMRLSLKNRFELESNHSLLGMVAEGSGWAITTPASFHRAKRFHDRIALHPFPRKRFSRMLSLFSNEYYPETTIEFIAETLRRSLSRHIVSPLVERFPWLGTDFGIVPGREQGEAGETPEG
ncbi:MAG: LysR family transcriptional regulator [Rhodobacteraceae bacterium]|nr:LysR family transcriptional regulator [Paracoccaceae bacterium]